MCFVLTLILGAFAVALWFKGIVLYAAAAGLIALIAFGFALRKIVKNAPCLFGGRHEC